MEDRSASASLAAAFLQERARFWDNAVYAFQDDLRWIPTHFAQVLRDYAAEVEALSQGAGGSGHQSSSEKSI